MSMRPAILIGINARLFPSNWRPAVDEITFAHTAGFTSIQFNGREHGLDDVYLGAEPSVVSQELRAVGMTPVMEIVVRLHADGRTATGMTPLDVLRANLPAIITLGCTCVHWHLAPGQRMTWADLRAIERATPQQLVEAVELAEQYGFRFGIEHNEPDIPLFNNPGICAELLDDVPGLGLVWDLNHTPPEQLGGFLDLAPRMSMLHLSDTPLPEVNHHLPIGMGSINFAECFDELFQGGFRGPAILEIGGLPKSGGYGRDTDAALAESLRQLVDILTILGIPSR